MKSILILGLLMGMRHALEADHLAAVASLATRVRGVRATVLQGAAWGLGHTLTLLLIGGACLWLGRSVPERWALGLELVVGVALLLLGFDILWRVRRQRVHLHVHRHDRGVVHLHAHRHPVGEGGHAAVHEHPHPRGPGRALLVGLIHGMAGSAALLLLTLHTAGSVGMGLAYIGLFGLGSLLGMAALCTVIAWPLAASVRRFAWLQRRLEVIVALATIGIAIRLLYGLG